MMRRVAYKLRIILHLYGINFISFKFNLNLVLFIFYLYNIPIEVAGESCKKTIAM